MKGLEIAEVSFKTAFESKNSRIDAEFFKKLPSENPLYTWRELGHYLSAAQYGISLAMNEESNGFPIYRMNEISEMLCNDQIAKHVEISSEEAEPFILHDRDILFNRTNSQELVGRTGLFKPFSNETRVFASYLIRLKTQSGILQPEFLVAFLNSNRGVLDIKRRARISINQSNVNAEEVKAIRIPLLSASFQSQIRERFEAAHLHIIAATMALQKAEHRLLESLKLEGGLTRELTYVSKASRVFRMNRWDAEFFAPKVEQLLTKLGKSRLFIGDVARSRNEVFVPTEGGEFQYMEIGDVQADGTAVSNPVPCSEAPSRAKWVVRTGDIVTSTVRPIRKLTALITGDQEGFVCSSGFVVLQPRKVSPELLLVYLRARPICELMDLHTSASMYPAISERDILQLPFPKIEYKDELEIIDSVKFSHSERHRARILLDCVRVAVELALDHNESEAKAFLKSREI